MKEVFLKKKKSKSSAGGRWTFFFGTGWVSMFHNSGVTFANIVDQKISDCSIPQRVQFALSNIHTKGLKKKKKTPSRIWNKHVWHWSLTLNSYKRTGQVKSKNFLWSFCHLEFMLRTILRTGKGWLQIWVPTDRPTSNNFGAHSQNTNGGLHIVCLYA